MFQGPSRAASHDGPLAVRTADHPARVTRARAAQLARGLQLLSFAIVAIVAVVAAGFSSPGPRVEGVAHPIVAAVHRHAPHWTSGRPLSRAQDTVASPTVDRDSVVVDLADDDLDDDDVDHRGEVRVHVGRDPALALRGARLSDRPRSNLRGHPQFDRSRFATGRGLLRGPPAS